MTPRSLDWRSVHPKLRKIEELAEALEALGSIDAARLRTEITTALAVERVITLLVELAFAVNGHIAVARLGRSPDTYAESFDLAGRSGAIDVELATALAPSAKMRNVLVHAYLDVDHYRRYAQQVARWFQEIDAE